MTALADAHPFWSMLREELAPRPGRVAACLRIAGSCSFVVAATMLHHIPLEGAVAYLIFLTSRSDSTSTLLTAAVGAVAATFAVVLAFVCYLLDADEPALRLAFMALLTFVGMFATRTMTIGPATFLAGFVLVYSQTLIDRVPSMEFLTRQLLWAWIVAVFPATTNVLVNLAFAPRPAALARRAVTELLGAIEATLRDPEAPAPDYATLTGAIELRQRADLLDRELRGRSTIDGRLLGTLGELVSLAAVLPEDTPASTRVALADACAACARAFAGDDAAPAGAWPDEAPNDAVRAMRRRLDELRAGIADRLVARDLPSKEPRSLFLPGALRDPAHLRYAIKSTIAVMTAYVIYSGLAWPGIATAVTTCFFVALGSLGETMHKLTLRVTGALIGGLVALLCLAFVLPRMVDVGDLCVLIAIVGFGAAWIATGGERIAYAGLQIAYAFFLGVLQGYGPPSGLRWAADTSEFTVLRDRVAGILLGNVIVAVVFGTLWPTSALTEGRKAFAKALASLDDVLDTKPEERLSFFRELVAARRLLGAAAFELRMLPQTRDAAAPMRTDALERLAGAVFTTTATDGSADARALLHTEIEVLRATAT